MDERSRRGAVTLLLALLGVLLTGGPAAADDIYEIDERLMAAGFTDAYTEAYDAYGQDGVRVSVDFTSESETLAAYQAEAGELAEVVWEHIDGRVLAVDVVPLSPTSWSGAELPPAVSFTRSALQAAHGPRPADLDAADLETFDDVPWEVFAGAGAVWLISVGVAVGITYAVMRSRRPQPQQWGGAPPPTWGPPPGTWGPPAQAWPLPQPALQPAPQPVPTPGPWAQPPG